MMGALGEKIPLGALRAAFGPGVDQIEIVEGKDAENEKIGALASTDGKRISLSSAVKLDPDEPKAMEVLAHEVAHALAGGGSGQTELDEKGDPGEANADDMGRQFGAWAAKGFEGPAPQLKPASGGKAKVHRWESAEHADAVDGSLARLTRSGDDALQEKADKARNLLDPHRKITLGNGMEVTCGEITALMGDFYGIYDEDGAFQPGASFEQMWNGDPKEMEQLLDLLHREQAGETILPGEWEKALEGRVGKSLDYTDPVTGETHNYQQLGYIELAGHNDNHFSAPGTEGTDNNLGTYSALHGMALTEAEYLKRGQSPATGMVGMSSLEQSLSCQEGVDAGGTTAGQSTSDDRLRAMEAASMHYLTDRHSAGHTFEKSGVMEASGYQADSAVDWLSWPGSAVGLDAAAGDGSSANLFVKRVHDAWNEGGVGVKNAEGKIWNALGDGHWDDRTPLPQLGGTRPRITQVSPCSGSDFSGICRHTTSKVSL